MRFLKYALCPFEYSLKSGKLGIPNGSSCLFSIVLSGAWTDKADGKSSTWFNWTDGIGWQTWNSLGKKAVWIWEHGQTNHQRP